MSHSAQQVRDVSSGNWNLVKPHSRSRVIPSMMR